MKKFHSIIRSKWFDLFFAVMFGYFATDYFKNGSLGLGWLFAIIATIDFASFVLKAFGHRIKGSISLDLSIKKEGK
jgi:hypothetical protein